MERVAPSATNFIQVDINLISKLLGGVDDLWDDRAVKEELDKKGMGWVGKCED